MQSDGNEQTSESTWSPMTQELAAQSLPDQSSVGPRVVLPPSRTLQNLLTPMQAIRGSTLCDICGLRTNQVRDCEVCERMFCWGPLATPCGAIAIHGQRCWLCWESPDLYRQAAPAEPGQTESCGKEVPIETQQKYEAEVFQPGANVEEPPGNCTGGHRGPGSADV